MKSAAFFRCSTLRWLDVSVKKKFSVQFEGHRNIGTFGKERIRQREDKLCTARLTVFQGWCSFKLTSKCRKTSRTGCQFKRTFALGTNYDRKMDL